MTDDLSVFWQNDERARTLFYELLERSERAAYDDDFLARLAAYREAECLLRGGTDAPNADIFAAHYLLHHGDAQAALICAERAYALRPVNYEVWKLLAAIYVRLGRTADALTMYGNAYGIYFAPEIPAELIRQGGTEGRARLTVALGCGNFAPIAKARVSMNGDAPAFQTDILLGEPLPLTPPPQAQRFWVACYTDNSFLSDHTFLAEELRHTDVFYRCGHRDFWFQLQQAVEVRGTVEVNVPEGSEVVLPVAGTEHLQELTVETQHIPARTAYLGTCAFSHFRLSETTRFTAATDAPYAVGTPICLGHSPARKKLVLNILVDGLSWNIAQSYFPEMMPNIARFFAHGVIFDQHFSVSEYTHPSLPTIETGRYPHHTMVFNDNDSHELPLAFKTLSECMADLGYYTTAPSASSDNVYCGAMRGYRQLNISSWKQPALDAADRAIMQLEAFDEADQFLFLHISDVHPWNAAGFKFHPSLEAHLPLAQRLFEADAHVPSVRLPKLFVYQEQFRQGLRKADRNIAPLLRYIEEHYAEEEYIVNLYADHGNSVFAAPTAGVADSLGTDAPHTEPVDIISANATRAVWMVRGAGVPHGIVAKELTSSADIYPTLGALCGFPVAEDIDGNLPAVFGGTARDAAVSMSMFPGQTFKLAVRTQEHALRLETRGVVDEDGTVDFAGAKTAIYPRAHECEEGCEIDSPALRAFFYPRAREIAREIANNGDRWPAMRAARPQWFGEE